MASEAPQIYQLLTQSLWTLVINRVLQTIMTNIRLTSKIFICYLVFQMIYNLYIIVFGWQYYYITSQSEQSDQYFNSKKHDFLQNQRITITILLIFRMPFVIIGSMICCFACTCTILAMCIFYNDRRVLQNMRDNNNVQGLTS